jgi:uncharacterized OsmC-like protein
MTQKEGMFPCEVTASSEESVNRAVSRARTGRHELFVDESEHIPGSEGEQEHPSPVDYLVAALVSCQVSVLEQALHEAGVDEYEIEAVGAVDSLGDDDIPDEMPAHTAARVDHVDVDLTLEVPEEYDDEARDCLNAYNAGCIVGQSLTRGIEYTSSKEIEIR